MGIDILHPNAGDESGKAPSLNARGSTLVALLIREAIATNHPIPFSELRSLDPRKPADFADSPSLLHTLIGS